MTGRHVTITAGSTPSISVTALVGSVVVEGVAKRAGKPLRWRDGGAGSQGRGRESRYVPPGSE